MTNHRCIKLTSFLIIVGVLAAMGSTALYAQEQTANKISAQEGKITANLKDIQITDILKILAEKSPYDFIISDGISGTVTLYVENMDPLQLLNVIAELANIAYEKRGNVIKVYSAQRYQQIYDREFVDKRETETIQLEHAKANTVAQSLQSVKSPKGTISIDANSNSLIVSDHPDKLKEIKQLINILDFARETEIFTVRYMSANKLVSLLMPYAAQSATMQVNNETNQLIVTDSEVGLSQIRSVVEAFDLPSNLETEVFHLRYPQNANLIKLVEEEVSEGIGRTTYDEATNSLIVTAIPQEMAKIRDILYDVDRSVESIMIEAKILQISLNDQFRMGVNWQYINNKLDSLNVRGIFNVLGSGEGGITIMGGNLNENNYQALIEALQTTGNTNLLSSPRIMAIEGEEAKILVGSTIPYKTIDTREEDGAIRTFEKVTTVDVGVKLFVTAQVNEDDAIVLDIRQEVSSVVAFRDGIPEISTSESETTVLVPDGITVVMAGLIKDEEIKVKNKVPLLGSIPLLGYFFSSTDNQQVKSELIVFLTPYITTGKATEKELEKLQRFEGPDM